MILFSCLDVYESFFLVELVEGSQNDLRLTGAPAKTELLGCGGEVRLVGAAQIELRPTLDSKQWQTEVLNIGMRFLESLVRFSR